MAIASETSEAGVSALHNLKQATDPQLWLTPNPIISQTARAASEYLFATLKPFTPKAPFDRLLVEGFDAEQIWQQIDLQSQPLLSSLKRKVNQLKKNPEEIELFGTALRDGIKAVEEKKEDQDEESDGFDEELDGLDEDDESVDEDEDEGLELGVRKNSENSEDEGSEEEDGEREEEEEEEEEEGESEEEEDGKDGGGIEDRFLKIKELEDYLVDGEEAEYGRREPKNKTKVKKKSLDDGEDDEDEDEDEDSEDDDELEDEDESGEDGETENAMYADFFTGKKTRDAKERTKVKSVRWSEHLNDGDGEDNEMQHSDESDHSEASSEEQNNEKLEAMSTHEKEQHKLRLKIKQLEKANLEPKTWTMTGEVTADKRPKNSALEEDLDFEHNVRPAPVITEEVTASLEEMIKKRILEGRFDDVQMISKLPAQAPREVKELDDNKSKKGLAEVYEEEYVQKTDPASAPLALNDEMKKEASLLFKKICLKLDALSHFHFTPKPVIEEMSIQSNVPALAMEEIAPVAVSDAAMLAPEEVFSGKGDIKEESELNQAERKRRRADKKRKFKAETAKRTVKKVRGTQSSNHVDGKEE